MNAVDTNVLVYAQDPRDARKRDIASSLIRELPDGVLLYQVACEYIAASRKLAPFGFSHHEAWNDLRTLRSAWASVLPSWEVHDRAEVIAATHGFSFWDALLAAARIQAGVDTLYSEDLGGRPAIDGLNFVDPFAVTV